MIKIEDRVSRIADRLEAEAGVDRQLLEAAVGSVLHQNLPPRDSIVLQEVRRRAALQTARAVEAWKQLRKRLARELPWATFELWVAPLQLVGEADGQLLLAGRTWAWVARRYAHRMSEMVEDLGLDGVAVLAPDSAAPEVRNDVENSAHESAQAREWDPSRSSGDQARDRGWTDRRGTADFRVSARARDDDPR
jgi:hypothetical protein